MRSLATSQRINDAPSAPSFASTIELRFFAFHLLRLFSLGLVLLCMPVEFQYVVRHMVGVPSILGEEAFGLDTRRLQKPHFIMNVSAGHQCMQPR